MITRQDNEDIEQEVYIKLWKNSDKYEERGSLKSWVNTVAKNASKDYLKSATFKKEQNCLDLRRQPTFDISGEQKLFDIMYEASGDGILEPKEFGKWAKRNYSKFFDLFKGLKDDKITELKSRQHIYTRTTKEECKFKNVMDDTLYEENNTKLKCSLAGRNLKAHKPHGWPE